MEQFIRSTLLCLVLMAALAACSEEKQERPIDLGYSYFPLDLGQERIYEADSLTFRPVSSGVAVDSTHFFVREVVRDTFRDAGGVLRYRIDRYERVRDADPWQLRMILSAVRQDRLAIRQEENLPYIKLVFPLRSGKTWDGNRYFNGDGLQQRVAGEAIEIFKEWSSSARSVDEPFSLAGTSYDSVATVLHADFESLVDIRRVEERYARGVGLIYREMLILDTQCQACCGGNTGPCLNLPWRDRAEAGFILRERLIDFRQP